MRLINLSYRATSSISQALIRPGRSSTDQQPCDGDHKLLGDVSLSGMNVNPLRAFETMDCLNLIKNPGIRPCGHLKPIATVCACVTAKGKLYQKFNCGV